MNEETRESLIYIQRTAQRLRFGAHPKPERALYLMQWHTERVRSNLLGPPIDDPEAP